MKAIKKRAWSTWEHFPSLVIGLVAIIAAVTLLISKHDLEVTSLAKAFPTFVEYLCLAILGSGGVSCVVGVVKKLPRLEGAGLSLVGSAYIMDFIAIISDRGVAGLMSGGLILGAGLMFWFYSFLLYPQRDYPCRDEPSLSEKPPQFKDGHL